MHCTRVGPPKFLPFFLPHHPALPSQTPPSPPLTHPFNPDHLLPQSELIDDEREDAEEDKKKAEDKKAAKKAAKEAAALEAAAIEAAVVEAKDAYSTMHDAHIAPMEEAKGVFDAMVSVERGESVEVEAAASDGTGSTTAAKGKTTDTTEAETTDGRRRAAPPPVE